MRAKGLDVSHWNYVDWDHWWSLGYRFAFIKVSEDIDFEDDAWADHYEDAKDTGFLVGPYHWFTPTVNGILQARWMYSIAGTGEWDFGPTLDVEESANIGTAAYGARVRACINEMSLLWYKKPIVYTSASKWKYTGNITVNADLWVAHWTGRPEPYLPVGWNKWTFWQYGITVLDQDRFNGTEEQLREYAGLDDNGIVHEQEIRVPRNADEINLYVRRTL